jgi:hypothetical protein
MMAEIYVSDVGLRSGCEQLAAELEARGFERLYMVDKANEHLCRWHCPSLGEGMVGVRAWKYSQQWEQGLYVAASITETMIPEHNKAIWQMFESQWNEDNAKGPGRMLWEDEGDA